MKKKIIAYSILGVALSLLVFAVCWFSLPCTGLSRKVNVDNFYSEWMDSLDDSSKLNEIVIPGSHDAGCSGMIPQARTQGHSIADQLKSGSRYFDVRVTNKGDDLVIFHGPIKGQKFSDVLSDFNDFLEEHPTEMIIIDFQHLNENHKPIIDMINNTLDMSKCLKPSSYPHISGITMADIRNGGYNFMIVWTSKNQTEIDEAMSNGFYVRDESLISEYNASKHKEGNEALIEEFSNYYKRYDSNKLFVLQAQRTAKTLLGRIGSYEKSFNKPINNYINSIADNKEILNKTNIIMRDFIASDINNINTILRLNLAKGIVKADKLDLYTLMVN